MKFIGNIDRLQSDSLAYRVGKFSIEVQKFEGFQAL